MEYNSMSITNSVVLLIHHGIYSTNVLLHTTYAVLVSMYYVLQYALIQYYNSYMQRYILGMDTNYE